MKSVVYFWEEKLKRCYKNLEKGKSEDKELHKWISDAIRVLEENAFSGIHIIIKL